MAEISGKTYIILGIFVTVVSAFIHFGTEQNFIIFVLVGIGGIAYGVLKSSGGDKKPASHKPYPHPQNVRYCKKCGQMARITDMFCPKCGNRF